MEGNLSTARFNYVFDVTDDGKGNYYVSVNDAIMFIDIKNNYVSLYAGQLNDYGDVVGPRLDSSFNYPTRIFYDLTFDLLYIMDYANYAIKQIENGKYLFSNCIYFLNFF